MYIFVSINNLYTHLSFSKYSLDWFLKVGHNNG